MSAHYVAKPITKRRASRLAHVRLSKTTQPYILDPVRMYEQEAEMVMRALCKWVVHRGWAPTVLDMVKDKDWSDPALRSYLGDLQASGMVRAEPQDGWMLTEAGSVSIDRVHETPVLPSSSISRGKMIAKRREIQKLLKDGSI